MLKVLSRRTAAALAGVVCFGAALSGTASAQIQLSVFEAGPIGPDATQAGGHADVRTTFYSPEDPTGGEGPIPIPQPLETPKSVTVDLPAGFAGDPTIAPTCTRTQFSASRCPTESQVGVAQLVIEPTGPSDASSLYGVYLLEPQKGHTAEFGFSVGGLANVIANATVRSGGDYGLHVELRNLPAEALPATFGSTLTLWGVPADPIHDTQRTVPGDSFVTGNPNPSRADPVPFLANPTECTGQPLQTRIAVDSWQNPGQFATATADAPPVTGCDRLSFEPELRFQPDNQRAGQPAGYAVDLTVPQTSAPDQLATAHVKNVAVTLPQGVSVSPSSADHLEGCTDAQVGLGSADPANCPAATKIGSVEISTPLLDDSLTGSIYLGQPKSFDAQTGEMLRLLLVAQGSGVRVKLQGNIVPDPVTGQLRATFNNNPQLPFDALKLRFQGGARAPLTNPQLCGTYTTNTTFTSWGGQTKGSADTMQVTQSGAGGACSPLGFAPAFTAGMLGTGAGAFSPFSMTLTRADSDQDLSSVAIDFPKGLMARISDATLCADAGAAVGDCPPNARIGRATVSAGAGSNPFYLPGDVYVTGPYKGAPFGLAVVVRAIAGPFDLGTVVVRTQIQVDRATAALKIVSDPFPTILQGIPLRLRTINVTADRPNFMFNPTSCNKSSVTAAIASVAGAVASGASRFQASNCRALPYRPKMTLKVGEKGRTKRGLTTPLDVTLAMTPGQANNRVVDVTLPLLLNSRLEVVNNRSACTPEQFAAERCPRTIGTASAVTPVLRDPLRGNVYLVRNPARRLPDMVVALKGQVNIDLTGKITINKDLTIRTAFDTIPDVPITKFALRLKGGEGGAVGVVRDLCLARSRREAVAKIGFRAQSGKFARANQKISIAGCGKKSTKKAVKK